jgi:hypothetical protein
VGVVRVVAATLAMAVVMVMALMMTGMAMATFRLMVAIFSVLTGASHTSEKSTPG